MIKRNNNNKIARWRFRREITLGTLVHLAVLVAMVIAGWSNLQKELALIRHELNRLTGSNVKLQNSIENLSFQYHQHEYRLRSLEVSKLPNNVNQLRQKTNQEK